MQETILRIENLCKTYAAKKALHNVSLNIKKGEIYGLIGKNGAGKTTLIRILNKIIEADSGTIFFHNHVITAKDVVKIGYLPEERGLYKNMTIKEQAMYFGQLKGMHKKETITQLNYWLDRFDILDWKNKNIQSLSKGMAQKVQFIFTVLHQPDLLILDEPFSGFDPVNANLIANELKILASKGTSIIFSSHRMESVTDMCTSLSLIHNGEILLQGSIADIQKKHATETYHVCVENPSTTKVNNFIALETYASKIIENTSEVFYAEITKKQTQNQDKLLQELLTLGELTLYKQHVPSLEEVFIKTIANA